MQQVHQEYPPMVFVDDEGLEEQFLTEDEDTQNILDTMANCVMTPMDTVPVDQGTQQVREEELDLQPSRGPREESLVNTIDQFLDENYEDVLRTSNIQTNFSLSTSNRKLTGHPVLPLGWIVPDGTNRTLEEIKDKKISNDCSPGGGQAGAVVMSLQRLEPYYGTQFFMVDLETGEMFAYITKVMQQQLLLNSKTTKQGIVQMASLFQEMIKAQEKRDLDPALLTIPTFSGEAGDRRQCLDWVSRVKTYLTSQDAHSVSNSLINQAFWYKILSEVSMRRPLTMNSQRRFYSSSLTSR